MKNNNAKKTAGKILFFIGLVILALTAALVLFLLYRNNYILLGREPVEHTEGEGIIIVISLIFGAGGSVISFPFVVSGLTLWILGAREAKRAVCPPYPPYPHYPQY